MVWRDPDEAEEIVATWEERSQFSKENYRFLTFSEFDQVENASIYSIEQSLPSYKSPLNFVPVNFLSNYFFETYKGKVET